MRLLKTLVVFAATAAASAKLCAPFKVCLWLGDGPSCESECWKGWTEVARDSCGDGACCQSGKKAFCCWAES